MQIIDNNRIKLDNHTSDGGHVELLIENGDIAIELHNPVGKDRHDMRVNPTELMKAIRMLFILREKEDITS